MIGTHATQCECKECSKIIKGTFNSMSDEKLVDYESTKLATFCKDDCKGRRTFSGSPCTCGFIEELNKLTDFVINSKHQRIKEWVEKKKWEYASEHMSGKNCICPDCNETKGHNDCLDDLLNFLNK
jgi:hypothetical protein